MANTTYIWNEKRNLGKIGTEKSWMEVKEGHYNDGGDKVYIQSKYTKRNGEVGFGKGISFTYDELKELVPMLQEALKNADSNL